jgi:hypothetical protein
MSVSGQKRTSHARFEMKEAANHDGLIDDFVQTEFAETPGLIRLELETRAACPSPRHT